MMEQDVTDEMLDRITGDDPPPLESWPAQAWIKLQREHERRRSEIARLRAALQQEQAEHGVRLGEVHVLCERLTEREQQVDALRAELEEARGGPIGRIIAELSSARAKFPSAEGSMTALVEEVGELARALLDEPWSRVEDEAVQVATMAIRVMEEGDPSLDGLRARRAEGIGAARRSPDDGQREAPCLDSRHLPDHPRRSSRQRLPGRIQGPAL